MEIKYLLSQIHIRQLYYIYVNRHNGIILQSRNTYILNKYLIIMSMMAKIGGNTVLKHSKQKLTGHFTEPDAKKVNKIQTINLGCTERVYLRLCICGMP